MRYNPSQKCRPTTWDSQHADETITVCYNGIKSAALLNQEDMVSKLLD
jgi:hypothetical protein